MTSKTTIGEREKEDQCKNQLDNFAVVQDALAEWPHRPTCGHRIAAIIRGHRALARYTSAMETPLSELRQKVQAELDGYRIPEAHPEAVGLPLPPSWFSGRLAEMRAALVMPHASKIRDSVEGTGELVIVDVAIVADDGQGTIVAYDPAADTYVLASTDPDPDEARGVNVVACGIRGTVVDCFLSA